MDDGVTALAVVIGQRVRERRHGRGWTLDALAEVAGVSRRMLVNVEQGSVNPSVGTLLRISDALGIGLPALIDAPRAVPVAVTRAGSGAMLWSSDAGGRGVLLVGTQPPNVVELWEWVLPAGDAHDSEAHVVGTQELLHVHDGILTMRVGAETVQLGPGDAATFAGDTPHRYANRTDRSVRFSLAVYEPDVGTRVGTRPGHALPETSEQ